MQALPMHTRVPLKVGHYRVREGLVFRVGDRGVVDDVVGATPQRWLGGAGGVLSVEEGDVVYAVTPSVVEAAPDSAPGRREARVRQLLWVRSGSAPEAVSRALRMLAEQCGDRLPEDLQLRDIAMVAGVRFETVSRVIRAAQKRGEVRREGRALTVVT